MEFALVVRELWGRKRLVAIGILVSIICAGLSVYQINQLLPPKFQKRSLEYSSSSIQAYVDSPRSFVADLTAQPSPAITRATIFADLMVSPGALELVGKDSGIPGDQIWAAGPVDPTQQRVVVEPTATKRNFEVSGEQQPYRIEFLADPNLPIISIYTQAPTTPQAIALANGSVRALNQYVRSLQQQQHIQPAAWVTIRTIGQASGALVNGGIAKKLAGLVFVVVFVAWCILVLTLTRFRANWRRSEFVLRRIASGDVNGFVPRRRGPGPAHHGPQGASLEEPEPWPLREPGSRILSRNR